MGLVPLGERPQRAPLPLLLREDAVRKGLSVSREAGPPPPDTQPTSTLMLAFLPLEL